jgi:hypothetical protein
MRHYEIGRWKSRNGWKLTSECDCTRHAARARLPASPFEAPRQHCGIEGVKTTLPRHYRTHHGARPRATAILLVARRMRAPEWRAKRSAAPR